MKRSYMIILYWLLCIAANPFFSQITWQFHRWSRVILVWAKPRRLRNQNHRRLLLHRSLVLLWYLARQPYGPRVDKHTTCIMSQLINEPIDQVYWSVFLIRTHIHDCMHHIAIWAHVTNLPNILSIDSIDSQQAVRRNDFAPRPAREAKRQCFEHLKTGGNSQDVWSMFAWLLGGFVQNKLLEMRLDWTLLCQWTVVYQLTIDVDVHILGFCRKLNVVSKPEVSAFIPFRVMLLATCHSVPWFVVAPLVRNPDFADFHS